MSGLRVSLGIADDGTLRGCADRRDVAVGVGVRWSAGASPMRGGDRRLEVRAGASNAVASWCHSIPDPFATPHETMYSTCLFCHQPLGRNDAVEHFPVGRRLAFDSAKGRLWVVCRKCERWNLTPLEERWEAVEECERAFRATKLRVSTDHIGLARLKEGTELVRIGEPQRPEMAAWRYGDQFGRRTRRNVLIGAGAVAALSVVTWGGAALGLFASGAMSGLSMAFYGGHSGYIVAGRLRTCMWAQRASRSLVTRGACRVDSRWKDGVGPRRALPQLERATRIHHERACGISPRA